MYRGQEELDNLVWDKNDEYAEKSQNKLRLETTCRRIEAFAHQKLGKPASIVAPLLFGGFNLLYRVRFQDQDGDVMIRIPCPDLVIFPEEKTMYEVATVVFLAERTKLPIPHQHSYGVDQEIGPYTIMDRVVFSSSVSKRLTRPNADAQAPHVLDPEASEPLLAKFWTQVAASLLEMSTLSFPRIGSLTERLNGAIEVTGRPLTHNMNDMIRLANTPSTVLPAPTDIFATADEWYTSLADMHIAQLVFQHNDLVVSEDDCRNKYVARQIFRRLARTGELSSFGFKEDSWSAQALDSNIDVSCPMPDGSCDFRLWGDDFRAGNILLDDSDQIAALIDWEYTYVAPSQFILDPPWWLLIETAEIWTEGTMAWIATYEERLKTWLTSMEKAEADFKGDAPFPKALSVYMRESWDTGRFWLSYGARKSWVFDMVFWRYLDERFFGSRKGWVPDEDLWRTRVHLLSDEEKDAMEPFVQRKMQEMKERKIVSWEEDEARRRLSELLFD